ncbi:MAG: Uma2 family endonuclease [Planctomycetota bacterium]
MSATIDDTNVPARQSVRGEPAWEIATLFPKQGMWSESAYLALPGNRLMELNDGCLEILPMPTYFHELIVEFLYDLLRVFVKERGLGKVMRAPLPIRLWDGQMREPDVLFLRPDRLQKLAEAGNRAQPDGADLVMEVVSPGAQNRDRDLEVKRQEYAKAGIAEYWIVDPELRTITVLELAGDAYLVAGECQPNQLATSTLLPGFTVSVDQVFQAAEQT